MNLSLYEKPLFAMQSALDQRRNAAYCQLQASGANRLNLRLSQGRVAHIASETGIVVRAMGAEKKAGAWRKSERLLRSLDVAKDYELFFKDLMLASQPSKDPRPPFMSPKKKSSLEGIGRAVYDPIVANGQASQLFHRLFQSLAQALQEGWMIDAKTSWINGRDVFGLSHAPFAFVDNRSAFFFPETRIDESYTLYRSERPGHRRVITQTRHVAAYPLDLSELLVELERCSKRPFLDLTARNVERVIFKPKAVVAFVQAYLEAFSKGGLGSEAMQREAFGESPILSEALWLRHAPEHPLFGAISLDEATDSAPLIAGGRSLIQTDSAMTYPVLEASCETVGSSFEQLLSEASRVLLIEDAQFIWPNACSASLQLFLPAGGVLYDRGQALGHIAPTAFSLPKKAIFGRAKAVDIPQRIGAFASCSLEIPASEWIDAARGGKSWA